MVKGTNHVPHLHPPSKRKQVETVATIDPETLANTTLFFFKGAPKESEAKAAKAVKSVAGYTVVCEICKVGGEAPIWTACRVCASKLAYPLDPSS